MDMKPKRLISAISITLSAVLLISALCIGGFIVNATEFNDENPELTLVNINGSVETESGETAYIPEGMLNQGGGKYSLTSNSYCVWGSTDDVSFAYREYPVAPIEGDSLTIETTLNGFAPDADKNKGAEAHANASTGIMLRSSLKNDAAVVFLHFRAQGLMNVWRPKETGGWKFSESKIIKFPVKIRMTVKENKVECRYQNDGENNWRLVGYCDFDYDGPIYAGIATHSVAEAVWVKGDFSDLKVYGTGSWTEGGTVSPDNKPIAPVEPVDPDVDLSGNPNIVLHETFSEDNKLALGKDAGLNTAMQYTWTSGKRLYNYTTGKFDMDEPLYATKKTINGNRFLYKELSEDCRAYIGDETWSDYKVSMDFQYTEVCDPLAKNAQNVIQLLGRCRYVEWYGISAYALTVRNETIMGKDVMTVSLFKYVNNNITNVEQAGRLVAGPYQLDASILGDGRWHSLTLSMFDNIIVGYYDGAEVVRYEDDGYDQRDIAGSATWEDIIGFGHVGIKTFQTDCYIDNIIVEIMPDSIGGNYDNYVGGKWDEPMPQGVVNWIETGYNYFNIAINGDNSLGSRKKN